MLILLSDREVAMLLGATLMHWGVPFRRATKNELTEHQQALVEEASERLIRLHEMFQRTPRQKGQEFEVSDQEAALLIRVVEDCLEECGSDPVELGLQLKTRDRTEVETLLERIRASLGSRCATLT